MLWAEPLGSNASISEDNVFQNQRGDAFFAKPQRFIVMKPKPGRYYSNCVYANYSMNVEIEAQTNQTNFHQRWPGGSQERINTSRAYNRVYNQYAASSVARRRQNA